MNYNLYDTTRFVQGFLRLGAFVALLTICACAPKEAERGHVDLNNTASQIVPNESHKQDVMRLMGSPSTTSNYGEETWYYIRTQKEAYLFFRADIKHQQVTSITFNPSGMVTKVEQFTEKDALDVATVDKITPTEGHKLGFMEQILGNLGRFNKSPKEAR